MNKQPEHDAEHERRVSELFCELAGLTSAARREALERARLEFPSVAAEVESLIGFMMMGQSWIGAPVVELGGIRDESPAEPTIGSIVGGWALQAPLSAGGTFISFRALREQDGLVGIVKLVRPELLGRAVIERFRRASALVWPQDTGIAAFYGAGVNEADGAVTAFVAAELVEGDAITSHTRAGKLHPSGIVELAARMCDAVAAGHRVGVPHTDLKPEGVRITGTGVKVLDFGLSRLVEEPHMSAAAAPGSRGGSGVGSGGGSGSAILSPGRSRIRSQSAYAAPEQVGDAAALPDARMDVFALGTLAHEMITGHAPKDGAGSRTGGIGPMGDVLRRAMSSDRMARHADAGELAAALRACPPEPAAEKRGWLGRVLGR